MIGTLSTSETSVNIYEATRRNIPEDSHFYSYFCLGKRLFARISLVTITYTG